MTIAEGCVAPSPPAEQGQAKATAQAEFGVGCRGGGSLRNIEWAVLMAGEALVR